MPTTGKVQFTGTQIESGHYDASYVPANAVDGDFTTIWSAHDADNGWLGIDLGVASVVTAVELAARIPENPGFQDGMQRAIGAQIQSAAAADFGTALNTYLTLGTTPVIFPGRMNHVAVGSGLSQRYWRVLGAAGTYGGNWAEIRFIGNAAVGANCRPCRPVISPYGGSTAAGTVSVTIACDTTSASIYYTTDGTTPTTASTLYSGAFTVPAATATTVRAIAHDATCSTPDSEECLAAKFRVHDFEANTDLQDVSTGVLLDQHNPSIAEFPAGSGIFYMASSSSFVYGANGSTDALGRLGINIFKSTDKIKWIEYGVVIPTPSGWTCLERPSLLVNPGGDLTLWCHADNSHDADDRARVFSCASGSDPTVAGNWTDHGDLNPNGIGYKDSSRVVFGGQGYVIYTVGAQNRIVIAKLSSDYLGTTGSVEGTDFWSVTPTEGTNAESPVAFDDDSGNLHVIYSSQANYYDSTQTYKIVETYTPDPTYTSGWSGTANFYDVDPVGSNMNGQPASIMTLPGRVGFVLVSDFWHNQDDEYNSRLVYMPIDLSGGSAKAAATANWNASDLPSSGPAVPTSFAHDGTDFTWDDVADVTWNIYRSVDGGSFTLLTSGIVSNRTTDGGATAGHVYAYKLTAVDGDSNESAPTDPLPLVDVPVNVSATTNGTTTLSVRAEDADATAAVFYTSTGGAYTARGTLSLSGGAAAGTIGGLAANTAYTVKAVGVGSGGWISDASDTASATTWKALTVVISDAGKPDRTISWTGTSSNNYKVYKNGSLVQSGATSPYTDTGAAGTSAAYQVKGFTAGAVQDALGIAAFSGRHKLPLNLSQSL